jgi:glycosyltransferase involved in cell wall biosynthesis
MSQLVSILIPAYNAEQWIRESIGSALSQTWQNKEIVVVDDGSTDRTLGIAEQYATSSVKVIAQEHRGANAARNTALALARGTYLQWLDADDLLAPDKIEKQMEEANRIADPRVLLTSTWAKFYYRPEKAQFISDGLWQDLDPIEWLITKFRENAWMNPSVWLVSRELTDLAGPWDERLVRDQDGEYISRVVSKSHGVRFVAEARSYYRQCNQQSVSRQLSNKSLESMFLATTLSIGYLRSLEDSVRTREACLRYLQGLMGYRGPEQVTILERATALAKQLRGELSIPPSSWKYSIVAKALGERTATYGQAAVGGLRAAVLSNWDKLMKRALPRT